MKIWRQALLSFIAILSLFSCAGQPSPEEYYTLGMAYFDVGKYDDAKKWLSHAAHDKRTMSAAEYNLGRIAFDANKYEDAVRHFKKVLTIDPQNVMTLKALAYSYLKLEDFANAETAYNTARSLSGSDAGTDSVYNYALVLFAMKKYEDVEALLEAVPSLLADNKDCLLVYARARKALHKPEAIDDYASLAAGSADAKIQYEYGTVLEEAQFYTRAVEAYRAAIKALPADSARPTLGAGHFALARALLAGDPENAEGPAELEAAVKAGFGDKKAMSDLLYTDGLSAEQKVLIQKVIDGKPLVEEKANDEAANSDGKPTDAKPTDGKKPESGSAANAPKKPSQTNEKTSTLKDTLDK